jgi:hypothetical protein
VTHKNASKGGNIILKKLIVFLLALLPMLATAQADYIGSYALPKEDSRMNALQSTRLDAKGRDPLGLAWYRISKQKLWGWGIVAAAGFVDGVTEGYEFDGRKSFERKFGVSPTSYAGSRSWEAQHYRNFKTDFYHNADDARKIGYIGGSICIGIGGAKVNTRWWHHAVDFGLGLLISGFAKSRGMNWVRYDDLLKFN